MCPIKTAKETNSKSNSLKLISIAILTTKIALKISPTNVKIAAIFVTNKPYDYALPLVSYFKELSDSKVLICPDHLKESKPSPEGILLACKKIGVSPSHTVYVGDHPNDLIAGKRAGTKTIGCLYGYSLSKDKNYKDSVIVKEASQIIDALKSI